MLTTNNQTNFSISEILDNHGFDSGVVADYLQSSLTQSWEYYDLVKTTLSTNEKDRELMRLCVIQNLLCAIRAASLHS